MAGERHTYPMCGEFLQTKHALATASHPVLAQGTARHCWPFELIQLEISPAGWRERMNQVGQMPCMWLMQLRNPAPCMVP